jgi:hypothetical protein
MTHYHARMAIPSNESTSVVATISAAHLAAAIRSAGRMDIKEKEAVCDRIYDAQPNLLYSVLAVRSFGVSMPSIEVLLDILIVAHLAVEESGQVLATVTEADQERELRRFTSTVRFAHELPGDAIAESVKQTVAYKREAFLLAYVYDMLRRTGLSELPNEASKYAFLAAMNLVNCIATARRITV